MRSVQYRPRTLGDRRVDHLAIDRDGSSAGLDRLIISIDNLACPVNFLIRRRERPGDGLDLGGMDREFAVETGSAGGVCVASNDVEVAKLGANRVVGGDAGCPRGRDDQEARRGQFGPVDGATHAHRLGEILAAEKQPINSRRVGKCLGL